MITVAAKGRDDGYVLGRTEREYERLRAQAQRAVATLHEAGHRQCDFARGDLRSGEPIPGAPFDLVYVRLLLFHLPQRVALLRALWEAVAPGGHLVVQDYDPDCVSALPALDGFDEVGRVIIEAFTAAGCEVRVGTCLPGRHHDRGAGRNDARESCARRRAFSRTPNAVAATDRRLEAPTASRRRRG